MIAGKAAQHFAMDIEKEQEVLINLADMVMDVYTAESGLLRAEITSSSVNASLDREIIAPAIRLT